MKYATQKIKHYLAIAIVLLPLSINAATLDDVVNSVNNVFTLIFAGVKSAVTATTNLLYEANPSLPQTMATNISQDEAQQLSSQRYATIAEIQTKKSVLGPSPDKTLSKDLSKDQQSVQSITIDKINNTHRNSVSLTPATTLALANQPATDYVPPINTLSVANITGEQPFMPLSFTDINANFNSSSLLAPNVYNPQQISNAYNFIQYLARLDQPLMDPNMAWDILDAKQKQDLQTTAAGQEYKVALRSMIANRSIGLNNLFYLMSQRIPQANLGSKAGMPTPNASPLEVENYMATRRTDNAVWYANMEKAAPATVAREQLYVLAEMEKLLFQIHMDNQRILATLSAMELQNVAQQRLQFKTIEGEAASSIGVTLSTSSGVEDISKQLGIQQPPTNPDK